MPMFHLQVGTNHSGHFTPMRLGDAYVRACEFQRTMGANMPSHLRRDTMLLEREMLGQNGAAVSLEQGYLKVLALLQG